jgi:hypothetical protein
MYQTVDVTSNELFSFSEGTSKAHDFFVLPLPFYERKEQEAARPVEEQSKEDVSKLLLQDENFRESIERARQEIKRRGPYYSFEDVFED